MSRRLRALALGSAMALALSGCGEAPAPPDTVVNVQGDEVTGSATPVEAMTQEGSVSVEFTLPVPDELVDCWA